VTERGAEQPDTLRKVTGEVVGSLAFHAARFLSGEVERAKQEAAAKVRESATGTAYLAGAGFLGLVSAGALVTLPLLALRRVLPAWAIALGTAGGAGAGAAVLAQRGLDRLRAAPGAGGEQRPRVLGGPPR
jgi:hypothetical protein